MYKQTHLCNILIFLKYAIKKGEGQHSSFCYQSNHPAWVPSDVRLRLLPPRSLRSVQICSILLAGKRNYCTIQDGHYNGMHWNTKSCVTGTRSHV